MRTNLTVLVMLAVSLLMAAHAYSEPPKVITEASYIPSKDQGIQLYVRNKRPEGMTKFSPDHILLFVHGATYPSETTFDLSVGGFSWMDYIAQSWGLRIQTDPLPVLW